MDWESIEASNKKVCEEFNNNPYEMSMFLSILNRNICINYKRCVVGSEVFSWILTGKEPKNIKKYLRDALSDKSYVDEYIDEVLCYIDDSEVSEDVRLSLIKSLKKNYLLYNYKNTRKNDFKKSRVRILTKIFWHEIQLIKIENRI